MFMGCGCDAVLEVILAAQAEIRLLVFIIYN
jgi:hypothetical protein